MTLKLTKRELNVLARVIELAWDSVEDQPQEGKHAGSKDQRSVWAASGALAKIRQHIKENP